MPVAAIVEDKILCMHGGLSPDLHGLDQILEIPRPIEVSDDGLLCDLLWSDPDPKTKRCGAELNRTIFVFRNEIMLSTKLLAKSTNFMSLASEKFIEYSVKSRV